MATKTSLGTQIGKFVFVSGINGGREVFFGRPIDEPYADTLTIEGKSITITPQGFMVVKPFVTLCTFPTKNANVQIQQLQNPEALHEANNLYNTSVATITRANYPLTYRWIESAIAWNTSAIASPAAWNTWGVNAIARTPANGYNAFTNPFSSFFEGFKSSAEQFRRALFQSPQVSTTREMDKLTELEGDLVIEIGKITNQVAVKFNQLVGRNTELTHYFESVQGFTLPIPTTNTMNGWCFLMNRLQMAKNWARRNGKTPLVREINTLTKEGINGLNEIILEHCSTLDTLITETFSQYGITFEIHGELSPFASYTTPFSGTIENIDAANTFSYAGAGV
jgi:hypothetical protein